jgi:hypothetical protein
MIADLHERFVTGDIACHDGDLYESV